MSRTHDNPVRVGPLEIRWWANDQAVIVAWPGSAGPLSHAPHAQEALRMYDAPEPSRSERWLSLRWPRLGSLVFKITERESNGTRAIVLWHNKPNPSERR